MNENRWPGFVDRNELASFCRSEAARLTNENNQVWDAMQSKGISDEDYESLFAKYYMCFGQVLGLRSVMEWCAKHRKLEEEMESENA